MGCHELSISESSCSDPSLAAAPVGQARTHAGPPATVMQASHFTARLTAKEAPCPGDEAEPLAEFPARALNQRENRGAFGVGAATS